MGRLEQIRTSSQRARRKEEGGDFFDEEPKGKSDPTMHRDEDAKSHAIEEGLGLGARVEKGEPRDALWVLERETHPDHAAPREANDDGAANRELTKRIEEGIGVIFQGEARRWFAPPVPRAVDDHHPTQAPERLELPAPHSAVKQEPMQQDDGRIARYPPFASGLVEKTPEPRANVRHRATIPYASGRD
jgi:hypothetical protein